MQPLTSPITSASVSGCNTTNGYSTRQSVASVTCDTRAKPSNVMLSLCVTLPNTFNTRLRRSQVSRNCTSKRSTAAAARATNSATFCLRASPSASATSTFRRFSTSRRRCRIASINIARRRGLSIKSSCKYGLRSTTQISPSNSNSMRALRPVLRSPRSDCRMSHASSPSRRMTISRSEKLV